VCVVTDWMQSDRKRARRVRFVIIAIVFCTVVLTLEWSELRSVRKLPDLNGDYTSPYVPRLFLPAAPVGGRFCEFSKCDRSPTSKYLYFIVSYRNRGANLERMVRTFAADAESPMSPIRPQCICMAIADFDDHVVGASVLTALKSWKYDYHVESIKGIPFSRTMGLQRMLNTALTTPANQSIMYLMDTDMVGYPGMLRYVVQNVKEGRRAYAPVCWDQRPEPGESPVNSTSGRWLIDGSGMMAFFYSDFNKVAGGRLPLLGKLTWGLEDIALTMLFHRQRLGLSVVRSCCPYLWHLYHEKAAWKDSEDGMPRYPNGSAIAVSSSSVNYDDPAQEHLWKQPDPPRDGPQYILKNNLIAKRRECPLASSGILYG
jgi:hypothetical protein